MNQKTNIEKGQKKKATRNTYRCRDIHSKIIIKTKFKTIINKQKSVRLKTINKQNTLRKHLKETNK